MYYFKNGTTIEYQIIRKNIKNTYFRIKNNILVITTNYAVPQEKIINIIDKQYDDITRKMDKLSNFKILDNEIYFMGKKYIKKIIPYFENKIEIDDEYFVIYLKNNNDKNQNKIILDFYQKSLEKEVNKYKEYFDKLFNIEAKIIYKPLKSAYGKNYIAKKQIYISLFLAKFDSKYVPYILAHEYTHFKYPNHQEGFHKLFDKIFPENRNYRKELIKETKKIGLN